MKLAPIYALPGPNLCSESQRKSERNFQPDLLQGLSVRIEKLWMVNNGVEYKRKQTQVHLRLVYIYIYIYICIWDILQGKIN